MVRHASWLPAVRAGEWTDAQTGVHSNLRDREGVKKWVRMGPRVLARAAGCLHGAASPRPETGLGVLSACLRLASI